MIEAAFVLKLDEGIHVLLRVVARKPEGLSVCRVRSSVVALFLSVVDVWDTFNAVNHGKRVFPERDVRYMRFKSWVIVVGYEVSKQRDLWRSVVRTEPWIE
jgi:hypothetical protein